MGLLEGGALPFSDSEDGGSAVWASALDRSLSVLERDVGGFFISMFALHLTQYACGISIQLSVHWSVVVFETHAERGDTHEGRQRKEARIWILSAESAWKRACSTTLFVSGTRTCVRVRNLLDSFHDP